MYNMYDIWGHVLVYSMYNIKGNLLVYNKYMWGHV